MLEAISTQFARHTQTTRLLRLTTPLGSEELLAECVHGTEAISEVYSFTISALSLESNSVGRREITVLSPRFYDVGGAFEYGRPSDYCDDLGVLAQPA